MLDIELDPPFGIAVLSNDVSASLLSPCGTERMTVADTFDRQPHFTDMTSLELSKQGTRIVFVQGCFPAQEEPMLLALSHASLVAAYTVMQ